MSSCPTCGAALTTPYCGRCGRPAGAPPPPRHREPGDVVSSVIDQAAFEFGGQMVCIVVGVAGAIATAVLLHDHLGGALDLIPIVAGYLAYRFMSRKVVFRKQYSWVCPCGLKGHLHTPDRERQCRQHYGL
jgi:hypothetical protein